MANNQSNSLQSEALLAAMVQLKARRHDLGIDEDVRGRGPLPTHFAAAQNCQSSNDYHLQNQNKALMRLQSNAGYARPGSSQSVTQDKRPYEQLFFEEAARLQEQQEIEKDRATAVAEAKAASIRVYPSLPALLHKRKLDAVSIVWHLFGHLDTDGRGILAIDELREMLTGKDSPLCFWTWRRLRQVLDEGEGIAWERAHARDGRMVVHCYAPHRVILAVDGHALQGAPVNLTVGDFIQGMHHYRAHVLAAWLHDNDNPVSQKAVREATGIAESTQRTYYKTATIKTRSNVAISSSATPENHQEAAWERGRGVYLHTDYNGRMGAKNKQYVAENLPSSYQTDLDKAPRGRQRKINKAVNLVNKRARGNGGGVDNSEPHIQRLYYRNGSEACKAYNKQQETVYYPAISRERSWPWAGLSPGRNSTDIWHKVMR